MEMNGKRFLYDDLAFLPEPMERRGFLQRVIWEKNSNRRWLARVPVLVVGAILLAMFVWSADGGQVDASIGLALALLGVGLALQTIVK